jgi:hypothetical protein
MTPEHTVGFVGDVHLRVLQREEIYTLGLPHIWYGQITFDAACYSEIAGHIKIYSGFITDGGSVPRLLWRILAPTDPDIYYPSFAHDLLYSTHGRTGHGKVITRKQCDQVLREQMLSIGAPKWKADMVYAGVRSGGWHAWNEKLEVRMTKLARTPMKLTRT